MDTTELIKNALDWADKRLTLQDQNLTETQRTYISFALSQNLVQNFALSGVSQQRELYCFECEIEMPTKVDNKSVLRCGNCGLKH